jgi:hypothetical protein
MLELWPGPCCQKNPKSLTQICKAGLQMWDPWNFWVWSCKLNVIYPKPCHTVLKFYVLLWFQYVCAFLGLLVTPSASPWHLSPALTIVTLDGKHGELGVVWLYMTSQTNHENGPMWIMQDTLARAVENHFIFLSCDYCFNHGTSEVDSSSDNNALTSSIYPVQVCECAYMWCLNSSKPWKGSEMIGDGCLMNMHSYVNWCRHCNYKV